MKNYQDFCNTISQQLFEIINKQGSLLSWHKNWESRGSQALPVGIKGTYHGANLFHLLFVQFKQGFQSNEWLTFNQIKQQGGQVKKGAKSQKVFFWKLNLKTENKEAQQEKNQETLKKPTPIFKLYSVFNLEQTTLEKTETITLPTPCTTIEEFIKHLKVEVAHYGNKAFYESQEDAIILPKPELFHSQENYYATLLHELVHWTGNPNRVPRDCFVDYSKNLEARAKEELIAEIGAVFLAMHFGLKAELENHASYVQSWKQLLSEKDILQATHKAAQIFEWLIGQGE